MRMHAHAHPHTRGASPAPSPPPPPSPLPHGVQLAAALEDVRWAVDHGLRSVLVADLGLLYVIGQLVKKGQLPSNLVSKVSVSIGPQNPVRLASG